MRDERVERLADVLVDYSVALQANDRVLIRGPYVAEPLMLALYRRCLARGAFPMLRATLPSAEPLFYRDASDEQLQYVWETDRWLVESLDVDIRILAETNTRALSRIDPKRQATFFKARKPLQDRRFERHAAGELRWNVTLFPTEALAMEAQMSLEEYEDLYYSACLLDSADPVAEWRALGEKHERLIAWMGGRDEVRIQGDGTDIVLSVRERTFIPADGTSNFPDGEIFTGPREDATEGFIAFTYPAIYNGIAVEGIRLEFERGRVVKATAQRNQRYLEDMLDMDPGARVLGEFGIGTNYGIASFTGEPLLDEKIGGTIHLALGASYPETGGVNESALHWDIVCDLRSGGRVTADGDPLMEDGKLLV